MIEQDIKNMQQQYINSFDHPLYQKFINLYKVSFPIFEQRTEKQQDKAFKNNKYKLLAFSEGVNLIGFISYWEFADYLYIEHFAINTDIRRKGYGSKILGSFILSTNKIILLEIDPIIDEVSAARLRFYDKCGFHTNQYSHYHPPYHEEYPAHSLIILTTKRQITEEEYRMFDSDLNETVMNKTDLYV